jgi:predicted DNA-binding antitoxin AbrB/MazE fold protein
MRQAVEAVFEDGGFKLVNPASLPLIEGQRVHLIVETAPNDLLELAAQVYAGLSAEQINEVERIALDRKHFFSEDHSQ